MHKSNVLFATLVLFGAIGCSVGPRYKQPTVSLPSQFTAPAAAAGSADTSAKAQPSDPEFWHSFHDQELTNLIERSLSANNDLRSALAHYDAAAALLRLSKFDKYPTVTASEDVGRQRLAANQAFGYPRNNRYSTSSI